MFLIRKYLFWGLILSICSYASPVFSHSQTLREEEFEAHAALLNHFSKLQKKESTIIVFSKTTTASQSMLLREVSSIKKRVPEASEEVIVDFLRVAQQDVSFNISRQLVRDEMPFLKLTQEKYIEIFSDNRALAENWKLFRRTFAPATRLFQFSRVGIDSAKKQALFIFSSRCGENCGEGALVLLQQKWLRWEVVRIENIWIS